ncbi:dethiobiotin synthase [Hoyosella altamirensis]|uniref:ATP-dependent dethiobiotin synthetase BioD n=1 Tax=Hoyosella altamirensis TaxID=616997 RepID=A0A839RPS5_9ACTN|nr:dethiobiotin synthase [Hoyosella altamirensis]MBB3038805.1 dethiobiotin synthase [Hoyosella altamirensis]
MSVLVITGTSTGVGKTVVTAGLAVLAKSRGLSVAVCKPAQTGVDDGAPGDLTEVIRLAGDIPVSELARYPEPLAPFTAARRSGRPMLTLSAIVTEIARLEAAHDLVLVEGAGGVLVELGQGGFTLRDVASAASAEVVLVAAAGLGTLNHTALTVEALERSDVRCTGIVVGALPAEPDLAMRCNLDDLPRISGIPIVGVLPDGCGEWTSAEFARGVAGWFTSEFAQAIAARADVSASGGVSDSL